MSEPLPKLPPRNPNAHKGDFGTALVIGGSRGMSGAAALAGMAALRGGAGLVRVAVPDRCLETVAAFEPCYTTIPLPCDEAGRITAAALPILREEAQKAAAARPRSRPGPFGRTRQARRHALSGNRQADGRRCRRAQRAVHAAGRFSRSARRSANSHAASGRVRPAHPQKVGRRSEKPSRGRSGRQVGRGRTC